MQFYFEQIEEGKTWTRRDKLQNFIIYIFV